MILKPFQYNYEPFDIYFNKISRAPLEYKEEILQTIKNIKENTNKPLYISLSGGIDSEVIIRACLEANIDFTAFTVKFVGNRNLHDSMYAAKLIEKYNINSFTITLNARDFFRGEFLKYKNAGYNSRNIFRYLQLYILDTIEQMGGCAILGGREEPFQVINGKIVIPWVKDQSLSSEWMINNNTQHYPYFFLSTPELVASYLETPLIKLLTKDSSYYTSKTFGLVAEKTLIYHHDWPEMERRVKYNGFERLLPLRREIEEMLGLEIPEVTYQLPLDLLKEQLGI